MFESVIVHRGLTAVVIHVEADSAKAAQRLLVDANYALCGLQDADEQAAEEQTAGAAKPEPKLAEGTAADPVSPAAAAPAASDAPTAS